MDNTEVSILCAIIFAIILICVMISMKRGDEGFDPSLRVAAGVGGPDYGDPVGQYYQQIQDMRNRYFMETGKEYPYKW